MNLKSKSVYGSEYSDAQNSVFDRGMSPLSAGQAVVGAPLSAGQAVVGASKMSEASDMAEKSSDYIDSRKLLLDIMMKKCGITNSDLHDISIVKSKLRSSNIDEIIS